jgi:hypothetical protein
VEDHISRVLERGAGMEERIEVEDVVVGRGRRPHGRLLLMDELRYPPRETARR